MRKTKLALMIILLIFLAATGYGGISRLKPPEPEQTPALSPTAAIKPTAVPSPSPTPEPPRNPLTGLETNEEYVNSRPYAVMLNNLRDALPQQGNSQADIIYEVVAEGGITRMLGVYQSLEDVGSIGSVRSARPYYIELALGHEAIYVHAGGSEEAYSDLSAWGVEHIDGVRGTFANAAEGVFWRDQYRAGGGKKYSYEHSLLTSGEKLINAAGKAGFSLQHGEGWENPLSFQDDGTPPEGDAASVVTVPFSGYKTGVFRYSEETGLYMVEEYGSAYIDGNSGEQLGVTNVLVLQVPCYNTNDYYGHMRVTLSSGNGWYACGGKIIPITWTKGERDGSMRYYNADGSELVLGRGKSYVSLIPLEKSVSVS